MQRGNTFVIFNLPIEIYYLTRNKVDWWAARFGLVVGLWEILERCSPLTAHLGTRTHATPKLSEKIKATALAWARRVGSFVRIRVAILGLEILEMR